MFSYDNNVCTYILEPPKKKGLSESQLIKGMLGSNHDQKTFLKCCYFSDRTNIFRNNTKHAEMNMLHYFEEHELKLPTTIWLSRSPCEECVIQLEAAYTREDPNFTPTIKLANISTGKSYIDRNLFGSLRVKYLVALMARGYRFETWDLEGEYRKIADPTRAIQELMEEYSKKKTEDRLGRCKMKCDEILAGINRHSTYPLLLPT